MLNLAENVVDYFEFKGRKYKLNLAFDNVLRFFELLSDDEVDENEKPFIALEMFIYRYDLIRFDSFEEAIGLFKFILKNYVGIDVDEADNDNENDEDQTVNKVVVMDYKKDSGLIFASFFAVYKIDLFEMQGKLDWRKFKILLDNLSDNSPFKKAVGYRTVKIPAVDKYNKEQVEHLRKMKQYYSLEKDIDEEQALNNLNEGFEAIAKMMK